MLCCVGLSVYVALWSAYSSNSGLSMLGCVRAIVVAVRYEVSLAFILVGLFWLFASYNLCAMVGYDGFFFVA